MVEVSGFQHSAAFPFQVPSRLRHTYPFSYRFCTYTHPHRSERRTPAVDLYLRGGGENASCCSVVRFRFALRVAPSVSAM